LLSIPSAAVRASIVRIKYSPQPEVLVETDLPFVESLWAQQPHPNIPACPTLPGSFKAIPPLEQADATRPQLSTQTAPTVSRGLRS